MKRNILPLSLALIMALTGFTGCSTKVVKSDTTTKEAEYKSLYHTEPKPVEKTMTATAETGNSKRSTNNNTAASDGKNASEYKSIYHTEPRPGEKTATTSGGGATHDGTMTASNAKNSGASAANASAATKNNDASNVYFDFNRSTLKKGDAKKLKKQAAALKKSTSKIVIEGYCDERGSAEYNVALGERRAHSVEKLLKKMGIKADRISTVSYGKEKPFCSEHNEGCWRQNRTARIVVK